MTKRGARHFPVHVCSTERQRIAGVQSQRGQSIFLISRGRGRPDKSGRVAQRLGRTVAWPVFRPSAFLHSAFGLQKNTCGVAHEEDKGEARRACSSSSKR